MMPRDELSGLTRDWNELASLDALWAIHSRRDKKYSRWTIEEFLQTGQVEVDGIMSHAARLGRPRVRETALDFGCGVGRLSRHLTKYFQHVHGLDISERMVTMGRAINKDVRNLELTVNLDSDLRSFPTESFDMVCSIIVLQHLPDAASIERYLTEFIRILRRDGLFVFQLPTALPKMRLLLARRTPYLALRRFGFAPEFLYFHLGLHPMRMTALPADRVADCIRDAGGTILDVVRLSRHDNLYYGTR
jgi:SAM-dependent methyltransferase